MGVDAFKAVKWSFTQNDAEQHCFRLDACVMHRVYMEETDPLPGVE